MMFILYLKMKLDVKKIAALLNNKKYNIFFGAGAIKHKKLILETLENSVIEEIDYPSLEDIKIEAIRLSKSKKFVSELFPIYLKPAV